MSLIQIRPFELDPYIQKEVGDPAYIDPSEILLWVDHPSFEKPMSYKLSSSASGDSALKYKGRLSGLQVRIVTLTWATPFPSRPIGFHKVYREVVVGTDSRMHNVFLQSEKVSSTQLQIVIDISESLSGVVIEYSYEQA